MPTKQSIVGRAQPDGERRAAILIPLAVESRCSRAAARTAAATLGLSERQIFTLIQRLRRANGDPAALTPLRSSGGRGQTRLDPVAEDIIQAVISEALQAEAAASVQELVGEVRRRCESVGVTPPSANTFRRRLAVLNGANTSLADGHCAESGSDTRIKQRSIQESDLDLLTTLYDGAGQPDGWNRFIAALTATYPGGKGGFVLHDPSIREGILPIAAGIEEDYWKSYEDYYASVNPWMAQIGTIPIGIAEHSDSLMPRSDLFKTEFYGDWLRLAKLDTGHCVTVQRDGSRFMVVTVLFPRMAVDKDAHILGRLQLLAPHMLRVSQLNRQISLLNARALAAETGLGSHHTALFVVDGTGKVVHHDALAEKFIEAGDGLRMVGGVLEAIYPVENESLKKMIVNAVQARQAIAAAPGGTMRINRPLGRKQFEVLVSPLSASGLVPGLIGSFAAVFVRDSRATGIPAAAHLQLAYGLTNAETRLMMALLREDTIETASERFNISRETVRSHLKSIFLKTGTRSQIELVRLGLSGLHEIRREMR